MVWRVQRWAGLQVPLNRRAWWSEHLGIQGARDRGRDPPQEPVVSSKSGHVFEKRLIQQYIQAEGKCPVTGQLLSLEDLIEVKGSKVRHWANCILFAVIAYR